MKKFLVIDDSAERQSSYSRMFNFIELDFAFSKKEFLEKIKNRYDGFFVDVMYTDQNYETYGFSDILDYIPDNKPLFIISEQWSSAMDNMKMGYLRNSVKYNNVLGYLSWNSIAGGSNEEILKDFVRQQINNYYEVAYGAFDENQSISILQISDIEFGNPGQEQNIETARETLKSCVRKKLRKLGFNNGKVDFICVCGDIAYKGEKEEYERAIRWLKTLGEEILVNENFENMLIVPGNHDYCYSGAAGYFFEYDKNQKAFIQRENNKNSEYHEHAMYNFAKFVYELNGEKSYLLSPYKPIIKRTYEDYGFNFILLNPIRISGDKTFKFGLEDCDMEHLLKSAEEIEEKDVCNIILSHLAPDRYSVIDPSSDSTNKDIRHIANELKIKGWFYGHAHDNEAIDDRKVGDHKVLLSRTNTLMLNNGEHCEGAGNGFTLFKLYRENNKVVNISYFDDTQDKEIFYNNLF